MFFRHPVEYHNNHAGVNLTRKVCLTYILPVLILSVGFCIPKWLELTINFQVIRSNDTLENGTMVRKWVIFHIPFIRDFLHKNSRDTWNLEKYQFWPLQQLIIFSNFKYSELKRNKTSQEKSPWSRYPLSSAFGLAQFALKENVYL